MIIARIEQERPTLRRSEARVADYVIGRPTIVVESSISDLAESVGVSEPTVIRFCRAVGCVGFQDLKRQLARDLERRRAAVQAQRTPNGPADTLVARIHEHLAAQVLASGQGIDASQFEDAVDAACGASQILVWSLERPSPDGEALAGGLRALGLDAVLTPPGPVPDSSVLVIALTATALEATNMGPALRRARAIGARCVHIGSNLADDIGTVLHVEGEGGGAQINTLCLMEALRLAVAARLSPLSSLFGGDAADSLQARKETAHASARSLSRASSSGWSLAVQDGQTATVKDLH